MKKLLSTLLLFVSIFAFGQTVPQGINYQAIALDQMGQPVPGHDIVGRPIDDAEIGVRLTILENSPTGTLLYQEEHEVLTDLYGMFNLVIGQGLQVSPDPFSSIDWIGDKYLKVELSIENNGSFTLAAVQQLMSVPYAFLAENAMVAQTAIDVDDADADPTNEIQGLSISNDTLYLSNGGFVVLPTDKVNDADDDPTNELQGLSISNDTIYLSNGGFVTLPTDQVNDADDDPTNELQVISIANDSIELSNGGKISIYDVGADYTIRSGTTGGGTGWIISLERNGVIQPDFFRVSAGAGIALSGNNSTDYTITNLSNDMDSTNEIQTLSLNGDTLYLSNGGSVVIPLSSKAEKLNDLLDAKSDVTGFYKSLFIGHSEDDSISNAFYNTAVGHGALTSLISGDGNTAIGFESLKSTKNGYHNVAIGYKALESNDFGSDNIAIGKNALAANVFGTSGRGSQNVAVGSNSLKDARSNGNVAFGGDGLRYLTTGQFNSVLGVHALRDLKTGTRNVAIGYASMIYSDTAVNFNTAIGAGSAEYNSGSSNIFIGANTGRYNKGNNNILIGNSAGNDSSFHSLNGILIIDNTYTNTPLIFGDFNSNHLKVNETLTVTSKIGIGTTTPQRNLHVSDVMRIEPRLSAPSNPQEGDLYMDGSIHKLMVYDGTQWKACW